MNGANQTEDFNGFRSQRFAVAVKPAERISTQFNYYFGREQRVRTSIFSLPFPISANTGAIGQTSPSS
jgi:hypothetical protein